MLVPPLSPPVPVLPIKKSTTTRRSRVCVNCRVSMWYGPLVMQPNGKKKRVSKKLGHILAYFRSKNGKLYGMKMILRQRSLERV